MNYLSTKRSIRILASTLIILSCIACADTDKDSGPIDDARLVQADESPAEWLSYGRNYSENRYSPLHQINADNVDSLSLAWSLVLGTKRGLEATPIVANGIMYFTGTWSKVYAVDARNGGILWEYDPQVPKEYGEKVCCDVVNRGVAIYQGNIFVGTLDGRLIALNAKSGQKNWEVVTVDQNKPYSITGAPRIVKGKVIIGNGGADFGVRGYVTAYDAKTGAQQWRFYTVPGNPEDGFENEAMETAAKTWTGEWWKYGGGGTPWDAMAYDPKLDLLYIGTGNGSPWNRDIRSPEGGDNLYLSSILALNPDNGKLFWHYQTTPGDSWDYTATQHIILADLTIDGQKRKVLMQAPKNGFFYVLDRTDGSFISAEPYVYTNWAKKIDKTTGRPVESEFARYPNMNSQISPTASGGHNWQPMAYNPKTGLVYIPASEEGMFFGQPSNWKHLNDSRSWNTAIGFDPSNETHIDSMANRNFGKLIAWDPIARKEKWNYWQKSVWNAGVLASNDLIFQGNAEGEFIAFDAATGKKVWSFPLNSGIIAAPMTYAIDGKQYVSILVGWGGVRGLWSKFTDQINPGTLYTFSLGGNAEMPEFPEQPKKQLVDLEFEAVPEQLENGGQLFQRYCASCHQMMLFPGGGSIPDLTYSPPAIFDSFQQIVGDGTLLGLGMPNFGDRLSNDDIIDIKGFILSVAKTRREDGESNP
ncbi:PQQ-dependent dehydrogenase, methanol/ethanol family [Pricia sp. S334]|uniref:PQQ-dependent dehydrogenase, methanol/ethanol family n=1 Tax=Pricia mediterranea TaxID=3076079 RepID=A0ABU3L399_9FLAO|nr:PQQ-dependent dehydrogenase, methanol/ethanol family [Pricia sp. S334]MDT7828214.1 PQQ-dependent dehydrogenase, methanol/ethanol family [Pricia sp. S334]